MLGSASCWSQTRTIDGVVRDSSGAVVSGAAVSIQAKQFQARTRTSERGEFEFKNIPATISSLEVTAPGFANLQVPINNEDSVTGRVEIVLVPNSIREQVTVSAARTELSISETPGSTILLSPTDIASTPALAVDDVLRQVPGFSLFRRSGTRTANPTTQGVSLRGLGASGASRALFLVDGVPFLDPFGSWIYWDRIPRAAISNAEVLRGGASGLYGSSAMGGVVQVLTRQPASPAISLETSYGNEDTPNLSLWTGAKLGAWDFGVASDMFRSDGYILVPVTDRGRVDTPANSEHGTLDFTVGHSLGTQGRFWGRGNLFKESRHNGTALQVNDTGIAFGAIGMDRQLGRNDSISARVFGDAQSYNQSFSSIAADRSSEALVNLQHVPAQEAGGEAVWHHLLGPQTFILGGDGLEVIGASDEQLFSSTSGLHFANNSAGGRQRTVGIFGEDIVRLGPWTLIGAARVDNWHNFRGSTVRTTLSSGSVAATEFADRGETAFSPRLSILRALTHNVSVTGSVYRAFRAPTLNELYRSFRLGSTVTDNNAALRAERLTGAEAGANLSALDGRLDVRSTFFWSDIVNPIANVTLSSTPALITRQRQNLGRTRSRGFELDGVAHLSSHGQVSAGYAYTDATVLQFPANTALRGLSIPQVPRNQFTVEARYWNAEKIMLSTQGRFVGNQFDDDQNKFPLGRYFALDLLAAYPLPHGFSVFAAVENLLNERYMVARTPTPNLGPPTLFRIGLRLNYPAN
jgi:outer membrane receptor protein involved in Fe transport